MLGLGRRVFASVTALILVLMWVPAAFVTGAQASGLDAGFEIDGNKVVDTQGNLDWNSPTVGTQPVENDDAKGDPTVYSASSKESDTSTWTLAGGAPPKDDITNVYAYAKSNTADVFFGFDRGATSGTDSYYLELNKLPNTDTVHYVPTRSNDDLRFRLDEQGNGVIALAEVKEWENGAWTDPSQTVDLSGFDYAVSADESFLEFSFNLTTLLSLQAQCPPLFGSLAFRNVTGATHENLKDFIKPIPLSAGSACGQLKILKHDGAGALLGGATFRITPDPRPIANPAAYLDVLDNSSYDTDPADGKITVDPVTPGEYTVTEHAAPSGYLVDTSSPSVHVPIAAANSPVPVFVDAQRSIPVPTGDLTLVKHVDQTSASYGDTLTYTFDAATTGDLDQTDVRVKDVVPDGTTYVGGSAACTDTGPCTAAYDEDTRTVSWQLGDVAHGSPARKLVFKVTIDKPTFDSTVGLPAATITNSGVIVSGETAETPSNKVTTTIIQVLGIKVVRKLPFTGAGIPPVTAAAVAALLIVAGSTLASARRRED
jgi:uncharacterized repeat protein (TIGR01451 family)